MIKKDNLYLLLYTSGVEVFKNNKFLGVGNKNYRIETCKPENVNLYTCNTHPHQIYLELLSEHGILGTSIIFFILYKLIFSKILITLKQDNYIKLGALIYMILVFTPIIPSGATEFSEVNLAWTLENTDHYACQYELQVMKIESDETGHYLLDWNKAVKVEINSVTAGGDSYNYALTEDIGYYFWRVRPVGDFYKGGIANIQNLGNWSAVQAPTDLFTLVATTTPKTIITTMRPIQHHQSNTKNRENRIFSHFDSISY